MPPTPLEREIKLRYRSAADARQAVLALGAVPLHGRRLQTDVLLDTPDGLLGSKGSTLRIRSEAGTSRLTFKGPVQPAAVKVREELETPVGDGAVLFRVFTELGLRIGFRYEKYREEFSHGDLVVAIDETPIGVFVELEGSEPEIAAAAAALGRPVRDCIVDSYRGLFLQHRQALGLPDGDMVFDASA